MGGINIALLFPFALTLALVLVYVASAPVHRRSIDMEAAHRYLKQFGYMTTDNPTDGELMYSMMDMQEFFGLSTTGQLDSDTMDMMSQPRCGIADVNPQLVAANCTPGDQGTSCRRRRYTLLGGPWDSTFLTYRFNNYTPDLNRNQVVSAIERALGEWAAVTPLSFTRRQDGTSAFGVSDIEIVFGPGSHGISHPSDSAFDGPSSFGGVVLAHAFNPGSVRFPDLRGDMHFDEDELWQDGAGIDLFTVAAHEFGHSLGLGHSDVPGALMFPTYYGYNPNFRLHEDDIQGIQSLYGPRPSTQGPTTRKVSTLMTTPGRATTSANTPTMARIDYCNAIYDATATLYTVFSDITTIAVKDQKYLPFANEDTILPDAYENPGESTLGVLWEDNANPVSALLEKQDSSLVVIRGTSYWEYQQTVFSPSIRLKPQFPRLLSSLGLPENVDIMAALVMRENDEVFLFSSTQFWTFDGNLENLDSGSPMAIQERWPGVPNGFNAAFVWQDNPCFIKGKDYWCYNETASEVGSEFPRSFSVDWLGCDPDIGSRAPTLEGYFRLLMISCCCLVIFLLR